MWSVYIRNGKVIVPSQFRTEAGFYLSGEPVYVSDLIDVDGTKQSIVKVRDRGCPIIATPPVKQFGRWAVLRYAGVSSVAAFERGAICWTIQKDDAQYRFGAVRKISPRGCETEPSKPRFLSNNLPTNDIADEIAKGIRNETPT
jgi:hypothetical protein